MQHIKLSKPQRRAYKATFHGEKIQSERRTNLPANISFHRLLTAVGVTVPGTYYILSTGNVKADHSHPGEAHHEEEASDDDGSERPQDSENRSSAQRGFGDDPPEGQTKEGGLEKKGMPGSQPEGQKAEPTEEGKQVPGQPGPDDKIRHESESGSGKFGEKQELVNDKEGDESLDRRLHVPDAKGGAKRRVESRQGKDLGQEEQQEGVDTEDKSAPSKDPVPGATSSKQAGLSNTNTKHSVAIGNDPGFSKKGEGAPDTAKQQGTVDPTRPQV